ncbi:hypothetical protein M3P05_09445 [Sansalvadorimonas sp. 2012CJ34-2]|uniref:Uncharacterized protein n=1 Tax=Parendozoicomonas callyspongiae TaxID=2942213 RepID=A0ABT0PFX1_9GAMM|nr:hypothetical protein [Sansalvadorimonas sp. 2012CJ34-2]MCL6270156.1 hypothetical protein [Sansalvadorimonas sp. 2012CJ34-2]
MAGFTDQACAYEIPIRADERRVGYIDFQPPSPVLFTAILITRPTGIQALSYIQHFLYNDCILAIETAAKALLYSHNSPSQRRYQPPPGKMFFESADNEERRLILFYEGLFEYSDSVPEKLTIYMSLIREDANKMTEPSFDTTPQPLLATIAYTVAANTDLLDYEPILDSINILTTPRLAKPVLIPSGPETPASQLTPTLTPTLVSTLTGACIGALTSSVAYLYVPHASSIPLIAIPGFSLCGLVWGENDRLKAIRGPRFPSSMNQTLVKRSRFTTQPRFGQQPCASVPAPEPVEGDEVVLATQPMRTRITPQKPKNE